MLYNIIINNIFTSCKQFTNKKYVYIWNLNYSILKLKITMNIFNKQLSSPPPLQKKIIHAKSENTKYWKYLGWFFPHHIIASLVFIHCFIHTCNTCSPHSCHQLSRRKLPIFFQHLDKCTSIYILLILGLTILHITPN